MSSGDEIIYVPYRQAGEPQRKAAVISVPFNIDNYTDTEIQILGHLAEAADLMNSIFRDQYEPKTGLIRQLLRMLLRVAEGETREKLYNYSIMLDLQNSPYALLPRKNALLDVSIEELNELADKAGGPSKRLLGDVGLLMTTGFETPDFANFYPVDFTDEEYEELGEDANVVNSSVIRDYDGEPLVILNEDLYRDSLVPVVEHLRAARELVEDPGFQLYLDAKIIELETGSEESRRIADYTWVRHDYKIDIVISTAIEVYLDNYKNARGAAAGGVFVRNDSAEKLLQAFVDHVPQWEANAPWTHKKTEIDPDTLPKLKFVDVLTWTGDYVTGPFTTIAQSLPNDEWVLKNVGTVNMVYSNTGRAVHSVAGNLSAECFLTKSEYEKVKDLLFEANQLHSALHEIGHTTGMMDPDHSSGQPRDYLEEEYSFLEETRAELFGLWSLEILIEDNVISPEMARACYDGMLITMITGLKFDPVQAHNMARNGMYHYFVEKGAIKQVEEDGATKFQLDHKTAKQVTTEMLKMIADLKAGGDKNNTVAFREKYVYTDPLKDEVEKRTSDFPLGRGLNFPSINKEGEKYTGELKYNEFTEQPKFNIVLT